MPLIDVLLLQSQRRSPSLSVVPTDGATRTLSPSHRVSYETTRPSPPPQQPRRHLSPVNNIDVASLVQPSNAHSLHISPSADASHKGTRTPGEAHARRSPGTQVHVTGILNLIFAPPHMYENTCTTAQMIPLSLINFLLLQSQRRSPSLSVALTDRAARTPPPPSGAVSFRHAARPSAPPKQPHRHLSPVRNRTVHRSSASSVLPSTGRRGGEERSSRARRTQVPTTTPRSADD